MDVHQLQPIEFHSSYKNQGQFGHFIKPYQQNPSTYEPIDSLLSALSQVKSQSINGGSALITVARDKFFCNGVDVPWGQPSTCLHLHQMVESFISVIVAFLSLPIPTIAAVSSHAATSRLVLALGYDYVLMRHNRGFLYMSEVNLVIRRPDLAFAIGDAVRGGLCSEREIEHNRERFQIPSCLWVFEIHGFKLIKSISFNLPKQRIWIWAPSNPNP